ncbi:MAG: LTA synthase family protein [Pseudobdellovibrionaceae bacterium]
MLGLTSAERFFNFWKWIQRWSILILLFALILTGFRFTAWLYYGLPVHFGDLLAVVFQAFWLGFRFDLSILCYLLVLPLLSLSFLSFLRKDHWIRPFGKLLRVYFFLTFGTMAFLSAINLGYYSYFQDHLNIMVFGFFEDDTWALLKTFWLNYPVIKYAFSFTFFLFALWRLIGFCTEDFPLEQRFEKISPAYLALSIFTLWIAVGLGARGSLSLFPLGPADTSISHDSFVNYLSYSPIHSLHRAIKLKGKTTEVEDGNLREFNYADPHQAFADYFDIPRDQVPSDATSLLERNFENPKVQGRPHVILVVMESFGNYWVQKHSEKFNLMGGLEKHFQEDFYFPDSLPGTQSTIGSVGALLSGTPHRPFSPFLTESHYLPVSFSTSPAKYFNQAGYQTRFVYGGQVGWRDVNKFAKTQGFQSIEGDAEIEKKLARPLEKHSWGIFDEDVFEYVKQVLNEAPQPQMIVILTTTNHPPYELPSKYQPLSLEIPPDLESKFNVDRKIIEARFRVYQYSNFFLSRFLTRIKESPLANQTLVSVTGDHAFLLTQFPENDFLDKWGVPIYFYLPPALRPTEFKPVSASHLDIFPTLIEHSASSGKYRSFGQNLFQPRQIPMATHSSRIAVADFGGIFAGRGDTFTAFRWSDDRHTLLETEATPQHQALAKKYKSLMASADYFFQQERRKTKTAP